MDSATLNVMEDAQVRAVMEHYLLDHDGREPKNTTRSYRPKQEEWKEWCKAKQWPPIPADWPPERLRPGQQLPGDLVDEGKLLLFLDEEVVSRAPKRGRRLAEARERYDQSQKAKRAAKRQKSLSGAAAVTPIVPDEDRRPEWSQSDDEGGVFEPDLRLKYNTVRGYISAIQRLYEGQKSRGINPASRPQGIALKALKKTILATKWSRTRKEYADRGVGTLKDVYLPAQIPDHTDVTWSERKAIGCAFRTQVDFLLGNHMLLRSSNRLPMELPDLFCLDVPNEGPRMDNSIPKVLVAIMRQGKTNQHGRLEYGAALRHRDPHACLVGAIAFSFFFRWQVEGVEPFPKFSRSKEWYNIKVLRRDANNPMAQLSSQTAREWTGKFYDRAGIKVSKKSHAPRVVSSQNADMAGVAEGQIRRMGRWTNGDQMTGCYLTSLPFQFMRSVADFDPEWSRSYFVPRAEVKPPVGLLVQIWPQLDRWKQAHNNPIPESGVEPNMAAGAFLELLEWLRDVLLQDAVFLRDTYPGHVIFRQSVFQCPEFDEFARAVKGYCAEPQPNAQIDFVRDFCPIVADHMSANARQGARLELSVAELKTEVKLLRSKIEEGQQREVHVTVSTASGHRPTIIHQVEPSTTSRCAEIAGATDARTSTAPERVSDAEALTAIMLAGHDKDSREPETPTYKLPRSLNSVQDLLRLWRHGLAGMPSVDSLEKTYGSRWRPPQEKNFFSTRRMIIGEIERRANLEGLPENVVARRMDDELQGRSLDKLYKSVREANKARRLSSGV